MILALVVVGSIDQSLDPLLPQKVSLGQVRNSCLIDKFIGCDLLLIELAKSALRKAGWPTAVGTGRMAFPLGGGVRYCQDSVELPKKTA
jgi:hypothetical protein